MQGAGSGEASGEGGRWARGGRSLRGRAGDRGRGRGGDWGRGRGGDWGRGRGGDWGRGRGGDGDRGRGGDWGRGRGGDWGRGRGGDWGRGRGGDWGRGRGGDGDRGRGGDWGRGRGGDWGRGRGGDWGRGRGGDWGRGRGGDWDRGRGGDRGRGSGEGWVDRGRERGREHASDERASSSAGWFQQRDSRPSTSASSQTVQSPWEKQPTGAASLPPRESAPQQPPIQKVTRQFQDSSLEKPESHQGPQLPIPKRRGQGTSGRKIDLEVNYLPVKLPNKDIVHYDVEITPVRSKLLFMMAMEELRRKCYPDRYPAYDKNKNLYSSELLPFGKKLENEEVTVKNEENGRDVSFSITITFAAYINPEKLQEFMDQNRETMDPPRKAMQAIDIILQHALNYRYVPAGRSFYFQPWVKGKGRFDLGGGLEGWFGFYPSFILQWKPFVNIDVAHKAFPKNQKVTYTLYELYESGLRRNDQGQPRDELFSRKLSEPILEKFRKFIVGLKVERYMRPGDPTSKRIYKVQEVKRASSQEMFEYEGQRITVQHYFDNIRKEKLKYPNLPCLHVGNIEKTNYLPVELCTIVAGQVVNKTLDGSQTTKMIREAAKKPHIRRQQILNDWSLVNFPADNTASKEFGLSFGGELAKVDARVLDPPKLQYKSTMVVPRNGEWNPVKFREAAEKCYYSIVCLDGYLKENFIRTFEDKLHTVGNKMGNEFECVQKPLWMKFDSYNVWKAMKELRECFSKLKEKGCTMVFVIIPPYEGVREAVKLVSEIQVGLLTQCLKAQTVQYKCNTQVMLNVIQKVNAKLGGINHTLGHSFRPCLDEPTMLIGADVTHPAPRSGKPSVAAVVASCEGTALFQYGFEWRLQPPRVEMIQDMESIVTKFLNLFMEKNKGQAPCKIIYYRDGVGEGFFSKVMNYELEGIRKACENIHKENYKPPLTFIMVQKRHHTRFFRTDEPEKNVEPGTIVDTLITNPVEGDFYLASHHSPQGTTRPTRYRVVWDDQNLHQDDLQMLTFYLCHMFSRCAKSVSYPAPTYYAHLAAFRAQEYLPRRQFDWNRFQTDEEKWERVRSMQDEVGNVEGSFINTWPMFFV